MMICKNLILNDNFDYEFPYDEAELLAELKNYVEIFGKIRKTYWNMEEDSYEKTVYLWIGNLYEYIVEGYNSLAIGNLYSFRILLRTILENIIYLECIIKYKKERLWKYWELYSFANVLRKISHIKIVQEHHIKEKLVEKFKKEGIFYTEEIRDTSWLKVLFEDSSIRELCKVLKHEKYYRDYRDLCGFVHGQNLFVKTNPSCFYNELIGKIALMVNMIFDIAVLIFEYVKKDEKILKDLIKQRKNIFWKIQEEGWVR